MTKPKNTQEKAPRLDQQAASTDNPASEQGGTGASDAGPAWPLDAPEGELADAWLALRDMGEVEARKTFPLLITAIAGRDEPVDFIRITAKRAGFRRAGMAHAGSAIDHPADTFSPEQLEQLLAEPMLIVELV